MIKTVSLVVQDPFTIVHINEYVPAINPFTKEVGDDGLTITADELVVQVPVPTLGIFPFNVVEAALHKF